MFRRIFINPDLPTRYRSNFIHLYLDIGWFGVLSGSAMNFLSVYMTRLGASSIQIGLLSAIGAMVTIFLAIPAGRWLEHRSINKAIFRSSIAARIFLLFWVPLPWLLNEQGQIWAMITFALLMAIPSSALGVGFNALFAAAVPQEWRASVAGIRNVVLSITFMATSLGSGYILDHISFPMGYQIVFAIGAIGALMSSLHLYFVHPISSASTVVEIQGSTTHFGNQSIMANEDLEKQNKKETITKQHKKWETVLRTEVWKTPFGTIMIVMMVFTLLHTLVLPLFPIYLVRNINLTDNQIGIGTSIFYLFHLIGSTRLASASRRFGHHKVTAYGSMAMFVFPVILGLTQSVQVYFLLQIFSGLAWSMVGGAQANYLLENIPEQDRPAYLAWYTLVVNASTLAGSLLGPALADRMGIKLALILFGALRLVGGFSILRWGKSRAQQKTGSSGI